MTLEAEVQNLIAPHERALADFCRRWGVVELSVFGSILGDDFRPDSDVDVLVAFDSARHLSLFDLVTMRDELSRMIGRDVDLVEDAAVRNPYRRRTIMTHRRVLYAA